MKLIIVNKKILVHTELVSIWYENVIYSGVLLYG